MISIIVPIYNTAEYLEKCMDSILSQSFEKIEIILVDDGSTDGSGLICDKYAKEDDRIKVIHKDNGGLVSARKTGVEVSNGDLIGFVDSDDWIESDMYEKLYACMLDNDVDIAMCGRFEESFGVSKSAYHGIAEGEYRGDELKEKVFPRMLVNGDFFEWGLYPSYWDKLFKREALEKYILSVDERIEMGEDAAGVYPCILNSKSIYVLKECLYHYRQSGNSMVRKKNSNAEQERTKFRILYKSVLKQFEEGVSIFDLREQWRQYVLFLMMARADILYKDFLNQEYLFPFPEIRKGSRIIVYGAGVWGFRLYGTLKENEEYEVVAFVDKNYENLKTDEINVVSPEDIDNYVYDAIIITVSYARVQKEILKSLEKRFPSRLIYVPNKDDVLSDKTMYAFGLLDEVEIDDI